MVQFPTVENVSIPSIYFPSVSIPSVYFPRFVSYLELRAQDDKKLGKCTVIQAKKTILNLVNKT